MKSSNKGGRSPSEAAKEECGNKAHSRIIRDYFAVTSQGSWSGGAEYYRERSRGLSRGLGDWLDVDGRHVFDLGCGTGELSWLLHHQGARSVVAVNLSEEEIARARECVPVEFICGDVLSFLSNCSDDSVDCIYALNILEHLDKDQLVCVLEHCQRSLTAGGVLIAMVPNAISPFGAMTRYWDITHQLAFTPASVRQLQRLCGFASVEFREWGPQPHGVVSTIRFVLWQLIRVGIAIRLMVETASHKGLVYTSDMLFRMRKVE